VRRLLTLALWEYRLRRYPRQRDALRRLRSQQWLAPGDLAEIQGQKLRRLVRQAYDHVPYYRSVLDEHGVRPNDIQTADDLRRLPILTKEIVRHRGADLRARAGVTWPQLVRANHTGGSTGAPLTFYQDQNYRDWNEMAHIRDYEMCGYRLGDSMAFVWGSDYDNKVHTTLRGKLRDYLEQVLYLDAFDAHEPDLDQFCLMLSRFKPRLLVGYVSSLTLLAGLALARKQRLVRPGAIESSAETLTPAQRDLLERAFGCQVFDRYGCREVGSIAHECPAHDGLHIAADNNVVEIVADGEPMAAGHDGSVIVTNLNNYAMPFIRYATGDIAIMAHHQCPCGRGLPLLEKVVGRSTDIIVCPSGKLLHGEFFTHLFYKLPGIREFQVIQRTKTRLEIHVVPEDGSMSDRSIESLKDTIRSYGDPDFEVRVLVVDRIERTPSGKYRFVVSELPAPFQQEEART
jgi:phenylacetate-CoA ligase